MIRKSEWHAWIYAIISYFPDRTRVKEEPKLAQPKPANDSDGKGDYLYLYEFCDVPAFACICVLN